MPETEHQAVLQRGYPQHKHGPVDTGVACQNGSRARMAQPSQPAKTVTSPLTFKRIFVIGERERANLVVQLARFFCLLLLLGECLAFLASGSDPTISIRYTRVCSTGEWLVPLYLICTRHIQTC